MDEPDVIRRVLMRKRQEDQSVKRNCDQGHRAMWPPAKESKQLLETKEARNIPLWKLWRKPALLTPTFSLLKLNSDF